MRRGNFITGSIIITISFLILGLCSCSVGKNKGDTEHSGSVVYKIWLYNSVTKNYVQSFQMLPNNKVIYTKDFAISVVPGVYLDWDNNGKDNTSGILFYEFIDLQKNIFYKYAHLSDTATAFQIYNLQQADTVQWRTGWKFFQDKIIFRSGSKMVNLSDTIIGNVAYKRTNIINHAGMDTARFTTSTLLSDCTIKERRFQISNDLDSLGSCPITKVIATGYPYNKIGMMGEIVFERNYLTEEEKKIFKAWEQNARKHDATLLKKD